MTVSLLTASVSASTRRRPCVGVSQTGSRRGLQQERLTRPSEESQLPQRVGGGRARGVGSRPLGAPTRCGRQLGGPTTFNLRSHYCPTETSPCVSPPGGTDPTLNWGVLQPPATCEVLGSESLWEVVPVSLWHPRPVGCSACAWDAHFPGLKHPRGHQVWAGTPTFPFKLLWGSGLLRSFNSQIRTPQATITLPTGALVASEGHGQAVGPRPQHQAPAHWLMEREGCDLEGEAPQEPEGGSQWFMENFSL